MASAACSGVTPLSLDVGVWFDGMLYGCVSISSSSIAPDSTPLLPLLVLALALVEVRHDLGREHLEALADVGMRVLPRLVEQDHLVDVRLFERAEPSAHGVDRADEPGADGRGLTLRRLLPGEVLLPQVHSARIDGAVRVVEDQRELEERPALGAALRLFVGVGEHEP